jgi:cobalt/nickel transport system ATP-binding protein
VMCNHALIEKHGLEKPHSLLPHVEMHHPRPESR